MDVRHRFLRSIPVAALLVCARASVPANAAPVPSVVCESPCAILAATTGYRSPLLVPGAAISDGSTVRFVDADAGSHPTSDAAASASPCFYVAVTKSGQPQDVTFHIAGGSIAATSTDIGGNLVTKPCASAVALPGGGYAVPFMCNVHPNMVGRLLVMQ